MFRLNKIIIIIIIIYYLLLLLLLLLLLFTFHFYWCEISVLAFLSI